MVFAAKQKKVRRRAVSSSYLIQPPVRGWIANEALANAKPGGARLLENWFPTKTSARLRGGSRKYATIGAYTFSRASTATYRNDAGLIATAAVDQIRKQGGAFLIEGAATNLMIRSGEISNSSWVGSNLTKTASAGLAPDGSNNATRLEETAVNAEHFLTLNGQAVTAGQPFTQSIFVKAVERSKFRIRLATNIGYLGDVRFNLSDGSISAQSANVTFAEIVPFANGWFRCSVSAVAQSGATTSSGGKYYIVNDDNGVTYLGEVGKGLLVWGAQFETGSAATSYIPTTTGAVTRAADVYDESVKSPVLRMWTYKSGTVEQFFSSTAANIYDITSVADPDIIPTPKVSGQSAGYYATAQFGTAGGDFLYAVNGADDALLYDGTTFKPINTSSTPAITGVATNKFSFVWSFASRLFFIEKNTMNVWYLPVDSIGGAAKVFSLAGVFQEGGSLLMGGKWSMDSGDGLDDKWVVVSTQGEVAVFQGTSPDNADTWQKVGIYKVTPPMGMNCQMQAGGDLLLGVEDGIVPISQAVNKDEAALSLASITAAIEPEWKKEVIARRTLPWEIMKWPTNNMMVVSLPVVDEGIQPYCFVANLETGAWTKFTGWETRSLCRFGIFGFFGTNDGTIHQMDVGGSDDGLPYVCSYVGLPDHLRSPGVFKIIHSARATFLSNVPFIPKISASVNYEIKLPTPPASVANFSADEWDSGLWDVAKWDSASAPMVSTKWVSIGASGFVASAQIQVTCGVTPLPRTELVAFELLYERGSVMN